MHECYLAECRGRHIVRQLLTLVLLIMLLLGYSHSV